MALLAAARPEPYGGWHLAGIWVGAGMALGVLGLATRAWAILGAAPGTSGRATRVMRADSLNTTGAYAWVRHPLYLGNLLLWLGVAVVSARPEAIVAAVGWFLLVYGRIAAAEDRFLRARFDGHFDEWAARTPSVVPRSWPRRAARADDHPVADSLRLIVSRDYHAGFAFVASTWAVAAARASGWPGRGWAIYLGVGASGFLLAHVLKRWTSLLDTSSATGAVGTGPAGSASADHDSGG